MTSTDTGKRAELAVADYLKKDGYEVLGQNWKTRWCEIDVIVQRDSTVFFVEVKYRRSNLQGDGLAYITPQKLRQMSFAAELWVSNHNWHGEYVLAVAAVTGEDFKVTDLIEL